MKRIKASFMFSLIFCSIFLAAFSYSKLEVKAAKQVVFEDDFESYTAGVFPSSGGWQLWFDGEGIEYQVILENVSFSPTKSLKLLGVDSWAAFATKGFTSTSPLIGFEVAVRVADVNGGSQDIARVAFTKKVSGPISCEYAPVTFQDSGTINSGGQVLQFYEADRWYKITLIMDRSSDAYNVWVDDELRGENLNVTTTSDSLSSNPTSGIEAFSVSQCYNGVTAYFDDVKIFSFFETNPRLELVPIWGIATTTLVGSGFTPNSRISVTLNGNAIPTVPSPLFTGDYGNFKGIISVLNQVEGEYTVRAVDEMGDAATAIFTVPGGPQGQDQLVVPDDYPTIQEAMNHAKEGATMLVKAGTYYENVVVNKPLTIKSQGGAENTIVRTPDPNSGKNVFEVWADDVEITGFTIEGSTNRTVPGDLFDPASYVDACGIYIGTCSGTKITSNIVRNNFEGIVFTDCSNILASENQVVDNIHEGVRIVYSSSATLIKNSIISTHDPEYVASTGLAVFHCTNSEVLENRIDAYINGAVISNSQGITFSNNNVTNNRFHGLNIVNGNGHKIFRNTLKKTLTASVPAAPQTPKSTRTHSRKTSTV
jgi:parallel beta-helix repeat protein